MDFVALEHSFTNGASIARLSNVDLSDDGTGRKLISPELSEDKGCIDSLSLLQ